MTQLVVTQQASLEVQARALGARYSRTSDEREAIARDGHALIQQYELQGGQYGTRWLERHMGVSHATAVNLRRAGRALDTGAAAGQGVSKLAEIGKWLEKGHSLQGAQHLADNLEARRKAAEEASIGVASVKYASNMTGEMASAYQAAVNVYAGSGVPIPPLPEMTVTLIQKGVSVLTRETARQDELGETPEQQAATPKPTRPGFYGWLAEQHPRECDCDGCPEPWGQYHHVLTRHGRRGHALESYNVLRLCHRHHQTGGAAAAHGPIKEHDWLTEQFGSPEHAWELMWNRTAQYAEWLKETI